MRASVQVCMDIWRASPALIETESVRVISSRSLCNAAALCASSSAHAAHARSADSPSGKAAGAASR